MENLPTLGETFAGKRVFITGHTGFKGAWLSRWFSRLDAQVWGYALDPDAAQSRLFALVREGGSFSHGADHRGDLLDRETLCDSVARARPDFVFHLAAQSLVRRSYANPVDTIAVNVLGTANLMEALRQEAPEAAVVAVTTDKCYENREWCYAYRETDALGGRDPYSASKAASELIVAAWRSSFFDCENSLGRVATARAGNVIGGGDFAQDRIIPDLVRAIQEERVLPVRSPQATRPWQHVLDCLSGYMTLARWLVHAPDASAIDAPRAFNFGPATDSERSVSDLVKACFSHWPGRWEDLSDRRTVHEATRLAVSSELAHSVLQWSPRWDFYTAVRESMVWYRTAATGSSDLELLALMDRQIASFS